MSYYEDRKKNSIKRLRHHLNELPSFLSEFFRGISDNTSSLTRLGYCYDLKLFFSYLIDNYNKFEDIKDIKDFTLEDLQKIDVDEIEGFMEYLSFYTKSIDGKEIDMKNESQGKSRKLAAVRTLFAYFHKKRKVENNPTLLVDFPKINSKTITRLEVNEVSELLCDVESGNKLTKKQKQYHSITKTRDLAIITLLLGTGMRVSECVGIDLEHIDFNINGVKITRKGGDDSILYFGDEVKSTLIEYLKYRNNLNLQNEHKNAFFLSMQNKRITVRSVQLLVKKYAQNVTKFKKISPHKLRSTFGTNLYRETGDIYLVADVLGHEDVNTTRKHYAQMEEERRKQAADFVKLRLD